MLELDECKTAVTEWNFNSGAKMSGEGVRMASMSPPTSAHV